MNHTLSEKVRLYASEKNWIEGNAVSQLRGTAELPGMDENNIDVKFSDGTLTIKGEKRDEREEKKKNFYLAERRYGSFQRSFSVPKSVDAGRIEANFKNGVLTVTLPKTPQARQNEKKIPVRQA